VSAVERRVRAGEIEIATRQWDGDGRPFVLVHGLASNARTWDLVATALSEAGHRVIAVDQRGHGLSDKPETGYGFDEVTADLASLIEALGLEGPIVAGQSWGGNVAVDFASRYPHLLSGMVLVDGGLIALSQRPGATWEKISVDLKPPNLLGMPREDLIARILADQPGWNEEQLSLQMGNYEALEDGTIRPWLRLEHHMEILWALWNQDATTLVDQLKTPTLMALADSGPQERRAMRVEQAERLEAARPQSVRWRRFEGAAHDIHVDQPDALAAWMLSAVEDGFFG